MLSGSSGFRRFGFVSQIRQQQSFGRSRCGSSDYFKEHGNEGRGSFPRSGNWRAWTAYELKNTNGDGFIMAHKGDLTIKIPQVRGLYRKASRPLAMLPINK